MTIKYEDGTESNKYAPLGNLKPGDTFRMPGHQQTPSNTIWMVTQNRSQHCERKGQVRTVSLKAGSVAYKDPELAIVRVKGHFQVTDWGED